MDLATILGLLLGWAAVLLGAIMKGGSIPYYVSVPSFILVMGGTVGATMVSYSLKEMIGLPKITMQALFEKKRDLAGTINKLIEFADKARREGLLALDNESQSVADPFLAKGLRLVVDGTDPALVRDILETELAYLEERHKVGEKIYMTMGGFSPTLGIIGTVISLINMMTKLDDPSKMGYMLAAAFVATLYGVAYANLIFIPLANKLKYRSAEEVLLRQITIEGVLSIQAGENPRMVEEKMRAFLPPALRARVGRHAAAATSTASSDAPAGATVPTTQ